MTAIWLILRAASPWHFAVAGFVAWSGFVGVKSFKSGGDARQAKIEAAANVITSKAEKARASVRAADAKRPAGVRDPASRD